jgi:hypothetical protein
VTPTLELGYLVSKQLVIEAHMRYVGYELTNGAASVDFRETSWGMSASIEF